MADPRTKRHRFQLLRRSDQQLVAAGLAVFLVFMAFHFWHRSIINNGLIEFRDLPARELTFLVDVNAAAWPELATLPGIGEKLSREIVRHRSQHGPFRSLDDLVQVEGIGEGKLNAMRPFMLKIHRPRKPIQTKANNE